MCGRIARIHQIKFYIEHFGLASAVNVTPTPRYNIGPGVLVEGVVQMKDGLHMGPMRWGFKAPFAAKQRPFNARAETIATAPMFAEAFRTRRCWVIADGFYEWKRQGQGKTPHFIHLRSGLPMTLAAIWSIDYEAHGARVATCAVITCPPNEVMARIHDRMPVILPEGARDRWLQRDAGAGELGELMASLPAEDLEAYEVSRVVNSVANDSEECLQRV